MNPDELRQKNRSERLALWRVASGTAGLVPFGVAVWLLDLGRTRVKHLLETNDLESRSVAGQRMILFSSVEAYATKLERKRQRKLELLRAKSMN